MVDQGAIHSMEKEEHYPRSSLASLLHVPRALDTILHDHFKVLLLQTFWQKKGPVIIIRLIKEQVIYDRYQPQ